MPIPFTCPYCGKETLVADQHGGQSGPCSGCDQTISVPGTPSTALPMTQPAAAGGQTGGGSCTRIVLIVVAACFFGLFSCGGVLVALLPVLKAPREPAYRAFCRNQLKNIALAFHHYHHVYGSFPPAYLPDEDGRPMHSWRVLLLPFLEHGDLYDMYDFSEPWDSPVNAVVTNKELRVFHCAWDPGATGLTTNYMVITGPGTVFEGSQSTSLLDIQDGTSNTLLVVEVAATGTNWAEPVDLDASSLTLPFARGGQPGSYHPRGINAAFCDGDVRFLSNSISPSIFHALITPDAGETVQPF